MLRVTNLKLIDSFVQMERERFVTNNFQVLCYYFPTSTTSNLRNIFKWTKSNKIKSNVSTMNFEALQKRKKWLKKTWLTMFDGLKKSTKNIFLDLNECLMNNGRGPCQDTCRNLIGGYECSCDGLPGTVLSADNHTCHDTTPCNYNNSGCSHTCLSTMGRVFCLCPDGYVLQDDWKTCQGNWHFCFIPLIKVGCRVMNDWTLASIYLAIF